MTTDNTNWDEVWEAPNWLEKFGQGAGDDKPQFRDMTRPTPESNEAELKNYYDQETPEGQELEGMRQRVDDENEQTILDDSDALYKSVGQKGIAPSDKDYDYSGLVRSGGSVTPNEDDGGFNLPNANIRPNTTEVHGYDLATGNKIREVTPDPDGLVAEGVNQLRGSQYNTVTGAPIEDTSALTKIGVGHIRNGGNYEDFKASMPDHFTEEQMAMSYRVADDYIRREDFTKFLEDGSIPAPENAPVQSWDITDDDLRANDTWMNSARVMYRNLEGEEFGGSEEELYDLSLEMMSQFGWNAGSMAYFTHQVMNGPDDMKRAMYIMMKMYENKDTTGTDVMNNLMSLGTDPFTYMSLGFGRVGVKGAQMVASKALGETLEKFVFLASTGAGEGAVFGGLDDFSNQMVEIEAGAKKEYDAWQTAKASAFTAGVGTVAAPALVFGGGKAIRYGKDLKGRVSQMRANPDPRSSGPMSRQRGTVGFDQPTQNEIHGEGVSSVPIIDQTPPPFAPDLKLPVTPSNQVAKYIDGRSKSTLGDRDVTEDIEFLGDAIAREVKAEMQKDRNKGRPASAKWYKETLEEARNIVAEVYPEVQKDMIHRSAFDFALAITSNGQNVRANSKSAIKAYKYWRENGKFPEETGYINAEKGPAMTQTFKEYNALVDELGVERITDLLRTEFSVKQLETMGYTVSGESKQTRLPFSVIFGPKVGGGFYSNLQGDWDRLTPDIWFTRTWGRLTGQLIKDNPTLAAKNYKAFRDNYVANKALIKSYMGYAPKVSEITDEWIDEVGPIIFSRWGRRKGADGKPYPDGDNPIHIVSRSIESRLKPQETPDGGGQRNLMRAAVNAALTKLNGEGHDLTMSSVQSTLWYPEQRLWDQLGSKQKNKELDYAKAFSETLGVDRAKGRPDVNPGDRGPEKPSVSGGLDPQLARAEVKTGSLRNLRKGPRGLNARGPSGPVYGVPKPRKGDAKDIRIDGARVEKVHAPSVKKTTEAGTPANVYKSINITTEPWNELASGPAADEAFNRAITKAKASMGPEGAAVYVYPAAGEGSLEGATKFLTADGQSGFAIKDDGDIVSIFNNSDRPNAALSALMLALENGGTKLDAFEVGLQRIYRQAGFQVTKRQKWEQKEMPKGWDKKFFKSFNNGEPDVVQMTYQPDHVGAPAKGEYGPFDTGPGGTIKTVKATPGEKAFFDVVTNSKADMVELLEQVPSFKMDKGNISVDTEDLSGFYNYITEAVIRRQTGDKLPPGFGNDAFLKKLEGEN